MARQDKRTDSQEREQAHSMVFSHSIAECRVSQGVNLGIKLLKCCGLLGPPTKFTTIAPRTTLCWETPGKWPYVKEEAK